MGIPTLSSATIGQTGRTLITVWNEAVNTSGGTFSLALRGRSLNLDDGGSSGNGTATITWDVATSALPVIPNGQIVTLTDPTGMVNSVSTAESNAAITAGPVTNSSAFVNHRVGRVARAVRR